MYKNINAIEVQCSHYILCELMGLEERKSKSAPYKWIWPPTTPLILRCALLGDQEGTFSSYLRPSHNTIPSLRCGCLACRILFACFPGPVGLSKFAFKSLMTPSKFQVTLPWSILTFISMASIISSLTLNALNNLEGMLDSQSARGDTWMIRLHLCLDLLITISAM